MAAGILLGAGFLAMADDTVLRRTIGALLLTIVAHHVVGRVGGRGPVSGGPVGGASVVGGPVSGALLVGRPVVAGPIGGTSVVGRPMVGGPVGGGRASGGGAGVPVAPRARP